MKVLITGANGFIGSNLRAMTGWDGVDIEECDIRSLAQITDAVSGYDTVIHLAALAGVERSITDEQEYYGTNVVGTMNVVQACREHGAKLVFAGSSSVHEVRSPYAKTKQICEQYIQRFKMPYLVLRFFTVFGENNRKDMAVYKFTQAIRSGEPITIYGQCVRDFTYVQDLCQGIVGAVDDDLRGVIDFGYGSPISVPYLVDAIGGVIGLPFEVIKKPGRGFDARATCSKDHAIKKYGSETPLVEALVNTIATI